MSPLYLLLSQGAQEAQVAGILLSDLSCTVLLGDKGSNCISGISLLTPVRYINSSVLNCCVRSIYNQKGWIIVKTRIYFLVKITFVIFHIFPAHNGNMLLFKFIVLEQCFYLLKSLWYKDLYKHIWPDMSNSFSCNSITISSFRKLYLFKSKGTLF